MTRTRKATHYARNKHAIELPIDLVDREVLVRVGGESRREGEIELEPTRSLPRPSPTALRYHAR